MLRRKKALGLSWASKQQPKPKDNFYHNMARNHEDDKHRGQARMLFSGGGLPSSMPWGWSSALRNNKTILELPGRAQTPFHVTHGSYSFDELWGGTSRVGTDIEQHRDISRRGGAGAVKARVVLSQPKTGSTWVHQCTAPESPWSGMRLSSRVLSAWERNVQDDRGGLCLSSSLVFGAPGYVWGCLGNTFILVKRYR